MPTLKQLRENILLSQKDVAQVLGVTFGTVSNWERGFKIPNFEHQRELAKLYGVEQDVITEAVRELTGGIYGITRSPVKYQKIEWHSRGFPEEPLENYPSEDADFEKVLLLMHESSPEDPIYVFLAWREKVTHSRIIPWHLKMRFWFLLGKLHYFRVELSAALEAFARCNEFFDSLDSRAKVHLCWWWGLAAHKGHYHQLAIEKYDELIQLVESMIGEQNTFIEEDIHCFLCNCYRQRAAVKAALKQLSSARDDLVFGAMPKLESWLENHTRMENPIRTNWNVPAKDQTEINWRMLRLFVPWEYANVVYWQAKLDPKSDGDQFMDAYFTLLAAANQSKKYPEGYGWTSAIFTFAAEMALLRYGALDKSDEFLRKSLRESIRLTLQDARTYRKTGATEQEDIIIELNLDLPEYELRYYEIISNDIKENLDDVVDKIKALMSRAERIDEPRFKVFTANCYRLLGKIAKGRAQLAEGKDKARYADEAGTSFSKAILILEQRDGSLYPPLQEEVKRELENLSGGNPLT